VQVVEFEPWSEIYVVPHAKHDPSTFQTLKDLSQKMGRLGYYGGQRLILVRWLAALIGQAACRLAKRRAHFWADAGTPGVLRPGR
jgi:hypothetical protein